MELEALVKPVVEATGLELVDITFGREGGRRVLRVTVDREGGVDLDAIAQTSEQLSRRLDLEDVSQGPYTLEVSSPGVERPLRRTDHFVRAIGETVKVRTDQPLEGARAHTGVLREADDERITVVVDGSERTIPRERITSARTVFEWGEGR